MADELVDGLHIMGIENESIDSKLTLKDNKIQDGNPLLQPELLGKVLSFLPQREMVRNRSLSRLWRDTIDNHCTVSVVIKEEDEFLDRKLQLRIRECKINWRMPSDPTNILFVHPHIMKRIEFRFSNQNAETIGQLLSQVKPYLHSLELRCDEFHENTVNSLLREPYEFPLLRELNILSENISGCRLYTSAYLRVLLSHSIPHLKSLRISVSPTQINIMDEAYRAIFNFLVEKQKTLKSLHIGISWRSMDRRTATNQLPDVDRILPESVKTLLYSGNLQFEDLFFNYFSPRYSFAWIPIIQSQRNLINFRVKSDIGVPFHAILPAIESSAATLRTIDLDGVSSVSLDGSTWIPLDCKAFKDVINLTELRLYCERGSTPKPDESEGAQITNLSQIPSACLKVLWIDRFVCDSGELQTVVDNSPLLEDLYLKETLAPVGNPRFASTGVHGGIIHSFVGKPNKKSISAYKTLNFSNQVENVKLDALRVLYPKPDIFGYPEDIQSFSRNFLRRFY